MRSKSTRMTTQRLTRLALLTAAAAVLGYFDNILSAAMLLPTGIKLGLANTVLLYAIYLLGPGSAVILMVLKVVLTGLMSGNLASAFLFSMGGGALSLAMMLLIRKLCKDSVSIVGVSVVGAVFHNVGQLLVASFVVQTMPLMVYLFPLLIAAVITGILTGMAGKQIVKALRIPGLDIPEKSDSSEDSK